MEACGLALWRQLFGHCTSWLIRADLVNEGADSCPTLLVATRPYLALEFLQLTLMLLLKTLVVCGTALVCFSVWWEVSCRSEVWCLLEKTKAKPKAKLFFTIHFSLFLTLAWWCVLVCNP